MYRKESEGWFKHTDFILIDMICLQIAFYLAYLIKGLGINPYNDLVYRNMAIVLELADLVTMFMLDMLHHVTQRGRYRELIATVGMWLRLVFWEVLTCLSCRKAKLTQE